MRRAAAALFALLALAGCRAGTATEAQPKPDLYVLTSLPLLFDDGFGLGPAKGEAATFLREHYTLKPIDLPSQLPPGAVLLAAQPRALPAEELVALDAWVRAGGGIVLLADPLLEWQGERPLGDRLRPPVSFADTGLLAHWGLRLDAPDKRGPRPVSYDGFELDYLSPGKLVRIGGGCEVLGDAVLAHCTLGTGSATIVADADLLNIAAIETTFGRRTGNLSVLDLRLSGLLSKAE
ncbi:MAG: DUF4350 domain-containing protein [Sphingomicrobium sp.]